MMTEYILTKAKKIALEKELEVLTTVKRREIAKKLEYAKSLGDLSENAEYHSAREEQAILEDRIRTIETMLKSSKIIRHRKGDVVEVGSTVIVEKTGASDDPKTFEIVGSEDSDIAKGRISYSSPLGSVLMGHKPGDEVTMKTPAGGNIKYLIKSVS